MQHISTKFFSGKDRTHVKSRSNCKTPTDERRINKSEVKLQKHFEKESMKTLQS